ncbi:HYR domain-containing protein [Desulforhopalus singaporensis]|uniref:HYR domain-containing protein n=1 Tax=Desulforhopalus singaporensis TaxID=91360 RepID=A0A1H0SHK5_9BACT|nr:HYR domain-containing protein [Desulforhopalus singaporensis]SDP41271.1 HYR domain-containing protein [Desulforhopalus singaporensis]
MSAQQAKMCLCIVMTIIFGIKVGFSYADYDCNNQALIDACVWGCSAAEGVCGGVCGPAEEACKLGCVAASGTCGYLCDSAEKSCKAGCTAASETCKVFCGAGEGACKFGIAAECGLECTFSDSCTVAGCIEERTAACDLKCDNCVADCKSDCEIPCDNCKLDCKSDCATECDDCALPCEEDCQLPCRQVGEECVPVDPGFGKQCADGLACFATLGLVNENAFTCFPAEAELFPDEVCLGFHKHALHFAAKTAGGAINYGANFSSSFVGMTSVESGPVYGADGEFGCYFTHCIGGETDIGLGLSGCAGLYLSYDDFKGVAEVSAQSVSAPPGSPPFGYTTQQVWNVSQQLWPPPLTGTADCFGLDASIAPFSFAVASCSTVVDTVGDYDFATGKMEIVINNPPVALCENKTVCADPVSCIAYADIDYGSYDPDGDDLAYSQSPPGPYSLGEHDVTLAVDDQNGATATCNAHVYLDDCTPPEITCPAPITQECTHSRQALVDLKDATATDTCSAVSVDHPGAASYPLGDTLVTYTATDAYLNTASCNTTVSVVDTTPPEIFCNSAAIAPPSVPISFNATAIDSCDTTSVTISNFDCYNFTKKQKRIDKTGSCVVEVEGGIIRIVDTGGVGNNISWTVEAFDPSGNSSTKICSVTVQHPGDIE